jgi:hypothetical protein
MLRRRGGGWDWSRTFVIAGVLVILVGLVGASAITMSGTGEPEDQDVARSTTTIDAKSLSATGRELVALLDRAKDQTYHARYTASSPELAENAQIRIETWRRPPSVRQDNELPFQGRVVMTSVFIRPQGSVQCRRAGDQPWNCQPIPPEQAAEADSLTGGVLEQLQKGTVIARNATVEQRQVRCFTLTVEGEDSELCATEEGVPVRVRSGSSEVRLVQLETEVPSGVFEPPA